MKLHSLLRTGLFMIGCCMWLQSSLMAADSGTQAALSDSDSIALFLKKPFPDDKDIATLNRLIEQQWKADPGSKNLIEQAQKTLELATVSGNELLKGDAHLNLARIHLAYLESALALKEALDAQKIFQKHNKHEKTAYLLMQLGIIYFTQYDYNQSLKYYASAIKEYKKVNNVKYLSTLYYLSGINYSKLKHNTQAFSYFQKALSLRDSVNDPQGIAECLVSMSESHIRQQHPDSALLLLEKARYYTNKIKPPGSNYGHARIHFLRAEAYLQKKEYNKALEQSLEGKPLAESLIAPELKMEGFNILHRVYAAQNNFDDAYRYLNQYYQLKDSLVNETAAKRFSQLEASFEIDKKQNEIKWFANLAKTRTRLLWVSIVIGVIALILAVAFSNKHRQERKSKRELEEAFTQLKHTQDKLLQQERLASLGQLTAGIAHEIKNPLNFVNNFSQISVELLREFHESTNEKEKNEILRDLETNLDKIASHGSRANGIMNMILDHSRTGDHELRETDIVKLCEEYFNFTYHSFRIHHPEFVCRFSIDTYDVIPPIRIAPQDISRVFINLFNNSLYAMDEKKNEDPRIEPAIRVEFMAADKILNMVIRDRGTGIPEEVIDKIFQPFFTTKPPGNGTGLGLSISNEIILTHDGKMTIKNAPTGGVIVDIVLPYT